MSTVQIVGLSLVMIVAIFMAIIVINLIRQNAELKYLVQRNDNAEVSDALRKEIEGLSRKINEDLARFNELLDKNNRDVTERLLNVINSELYKNMQTTEKIVTDLNRRFEGLEKMKVDLQKISNGLLTLEALLRGKKTRGIDGEVELYTIFENVFGIDPKRWAKQISLSNGMVADAVMYAPEPLGKIVVDSHIPLENFQNIYANTSIGQTTFRKAFKADVLKHIDDIAKKYIIPGETAAVAYMFIPAETVYAEIHAFLPEVVEHSYSKNVYIVSPTTLTSYLKASKAIYLGQGRDDRIPLL